jgi:hypothetical protein
MGLSSGIDPEAEEIITMYMWMPIEDLKKVKAAEGERGYKKDF